MNALQAICDLQSLREQRLVLIEWGASTTDIDAAIDEVLDWMNDNEAA